MNLGNGTSPCHFPEFWKSKGDDKYFTKDIMKKGSEIVLKSLQNES